MAKFKIAQDPTFEAEVSVPRVAGDPVLVPFTFKYRNREELSALYDGWRDAGEAISKRFEGANPSLTDITNSQINLQVEQIRDMVVGWGFEDEFSPSAIRELVITCVGAAEAVVAAYTAAFAQARQGN